MGAFSKSSFAIAALALVSACSVIPDGGVRPASPSRSPQAQTPPRLPQPNINTPPAPIGTETPPPPLKAINPASSFSLANAGQLAFLGTDKTRATGAGIALGPDIASLNLRSDPAKVHAAFLAFRTSCGSLSRRIDNSGLTQGADWKRSCDAAKNWNESDAPRFFETHFEAVQVGDGSSFATGYFEPQIKGARNRSSAAQVPIYRRPPNLLDVDLGQFSAELKDKKIRGKIEGANLVPFEDRAAIDAGALTGKGLELAWAEDYIEFFFLQIQGSGRLLMPNGSVMRIGYDGQNGRDYVGIGKLMRERGLLADGKTNMQGIVEWLRANPAEGKRIMEENKSFIFFREIEGAGPIGAMGLPVVARTSVATDRQFVPLGAPVFLNMAHDIADGLWIAQDTGGAIKGANRFDTFWGAGDEAAVIAGGMSSNGQALVFLPKGSFKKLTGR